MQYLIEYLEQMHNGHNIQCNHFLKNMYIFGLCQFKHRGIVCRVKCAMIWNEFDSYHACVWIQSTVIHLPRCIASCITTCLRAQGIVEEPENAALCLTDFQQRGNIFLSLREIRVKHYLWTENHCQRFQFLTDSNSHRLYQRFGGSRPSLVHLAFWSSQSFSVFFADKTTVALSWCWVSFFCKGKGIRYRHH